MQYFFAEYGLKGEPMKKYEFAEKRIRVAFYGLGAIGIGAARIALDNPNFEVVAAIDKEPDKIGKDIFQLIGQKRNAGVKVTSSLKEALSQTEIEVVVLATGSYVKEVFPQISEIVSSGINCVSSTEELFFPFWKKSNLAKRLDDLAKKHGVSILGTGVNPGFVMDTLPVFLTSVCKKVERVQVKRVVDVATRRLALQKKVGLGMSVEQFRQEAKLGAS